MRAIITTGQDDLTIIETATPVPGPEQVLVRIEAAGVNPVDVATRLGIFHGSVIPAAAATGLGWDLAGTVEAVGPDVAGFAVGDRIAAVLSGFDIPLRAYADFALVPAAALAIIPDGLDFVGAATIPLNALTAAQALDLFGPAAGRSLLITGAAGAVGGFAVPLAVADGWRVTALARPQDADFLTQAGAHRLLTELPATPEFDAVLDAANLFGAALAATVDGGVYVGLTPAANPPGERDITVTAVFSHHDGPRLTQLLARVAAGELAVRLAGTLPLADAAQAHENVAKGGQRGRWVLVG